jgi:RimJ/RimL family protein N-acetyltransferase
MNEPSARSLVKWQYGPPYDLYNSDPSEQDSLVQFLVEPSNGYYAIRDDRRDLVAFCCFGRDAQVPGGDYRLAACDIGLGLRPDLTGRGLGAVFVRAVLDFAAQHLDPSRFRVTIAEFNRRAISVWRAVGFQPVDVFRRESDGMQFIILTESADEVFHAGG